EAADADDVAGRCFFDVDAVQAVVTHQLQDTTVAALAVGIDGDDRSVRLDATTGDTANTDHTQEAAVVQCRNPHLERTVTVDFRGWNVVDDRLVQRGHVFRHGGVVQAGNTVQGRSVNNLKVQLFVGGTQVVEQVENLVQNPVRTRARTVDLVDHD